MEPESGATGAVPGEVGDPGSGRSRALPRGRWSREGGAVLWFVLLAVLLTFPASLRPGQGVLGYTGSDVWEHLWGKWRDYRDLLDGAPFRLQTDLLGHPRGGLLWDPDPVGRLLSPLLIALAGIPAGYNLGVMAVLALNGWTAFLLVRSEVRDRAAAIAGGTVVAVAPYTLSQVGNGIDEQQHLWLVSLCLWVWVRYLRRPGRGALLALWSVASLLAVANVYYVQYAAVAALLLFRPVLRESGRPEPRPLRRLAVAAAVPAGVALLWYGRYARYLASRDRLDWRDPDRWGGAPSWHHHAWFEGTFVPPQVVGDPLLRALWLGLLGAIAVALVATLAGGASRPATWSRARRSGAWGIAGLAGLPVVSSMTGAAVLSPSPAAIWRMRRAAGTLEPACSIPDALAARVPPWLLDAGRAPRPFGQSIDFQFVAYLGTTLLLAVLAVTLLRHRARKWAVVAALTTLWSFGPVLDFPAWIGRATGVDSVPLPYVYLFPLLEKLLPALRGMQFAYRAHALALIAAAVAFALLLEWLRARGARGLAMALAGAVLMELGPLSPLPWPAPFSPLPEVEGLASMGGDPEPGAVLEVPDYQLYGEAGIGYALYGQTVHGRPVAYTIHPRPRQDGRDNVFRDLNEMVCPSVPEAVAASARRLERLLDPDHVLRDVQGMADDGLRYLVIRDDLPYADAEVRSRALVRLAEEVIGWERIGERPRVYRITPVPRLARPDLLSRAAGPETPDVP